jgi:hypothetical protein
MSLDSSVDYILSRISQNDFESERQIVAIIIIIIISLLSRKCDDRLDKNGVNQSKIFLIISRISPDVVLMSVDLPVKYPLFPII